MRPDWNGLEERQVTGDDSTILLYVPVLRDDAGLTVAHRRC
jgi:hypothetical protein